jgi:hypothetical protein
VVVDTVDPSSSDADKLDLIRYSGFQMLGMGHPAQWTDQAELRHPAAVGDYRRVGG